MAMQRRLQGLVAFLLLSAAVCQAAEPHFFENFQDDVLDEKWHHSEDDKYTGEFVIETPPGLDQPALKVPEPAKHYGLATKLDKEVNPAEGLVLQYDLKLTDGISCGGAYLKFLTAGSFDPTALRDDTPYTIMFGPDKCGMTNKVHLILRHKSPVGKIEEKHLKFPPSLVDDKKTHVYTAVLKPDNTFEVLIDGEVKKSGNILEDFDPAINPPEEIDDPEDTKPADWVDTAKIADPEASKPDDWDEDAPRMIPDPTATKPEGWLDDEPTEIDDPSASQPEDWDEDEDGEWEAPQVPNPKCKEVGCGEWKAPMVPNPEYKGKWTAPMIDNPEYKGVWAPRKIANPDYFEDETPLASIGKIGGVAVEIWTMDKGAYFSNILIASDPAVAAEYREKTWMPKKAVEDEAAAEEEEAKPVSAEGASLRQQLIGHLRTLLGQKWLSDIPALRQRGDQLMEFVERSDTNAAIVAATVAAAVLFLAGSLIRACMPRRRAPSATSVGRAKKEDITPMDDVTDATAKPDAASTLPVPVAGPAAGAAAGEIQATADDEEEEDVQGATTRRRARRET